MLHLRGQLLLKFRKASFGLTNNFGPQISLRRLIHGRKGVDGEGIEGVHGLQVRV